MNENVERFNPGISAEEFDRHYWYKTELQQICRQIGLPTTGTKAELEKHIKSYLRGEKAETTRNRQTNLRKRQQPGKKITLDMRLIPDGFKFNQEARTFFADYYQVKKFSFNKDMATALREAERRGDHTMTVHDLIKVYENSKKGKRISGQTDEEKTYQWNRFVKEFHGDPVTAQYKRKLKVAAFLWKKVRERPGPKQYRSRLLEEYKEAIEKIEQEA